MQNQTWTLVELLLAKEGVPYPASLRESICVFLQLLKDANSFCGLVSPHELQHLESSHIPDALSLAGWVMRSGGLESGYLDIGSGGGFPAIPVLLALPHVKGILVERSTRKAGFLQRVVGALQMTHVEVVCGEFPQASRGKTFGVVTARAVEKPGHVLKAVLRELTAGGVFLCQSGLGGRVESEMFHVEPIKDSWTEARLRRGTLELIKSAG